MVITASRLPPLPNPTFSRLNLLCTMRPACYSPHPVCLLARASAGKFGSLELYGWKS
jgi:hypothetical protein